MAIRTRHQRHLVGISTPADDDTFPLTVAITSAATIVKPVVRVNFNVFDNTAQRAFLLRSHAGLPALDGCVLLIADSALLVNSLSALARAFQNFNVSAELDDFA